MYQPKKNVVKIMLVVGVAFMLLGNLLAIDLLGFRLIITRRDNRPAPQQNEYPIRIEVEDSKSDDFDRESLDIKHTQKSGISPLSIIGLNETDLPGVNQRTVSIVFNNDKVEHNTEESFTILRFDDNEILKSARAGGCPQLHQQHILNSFRGDYNIDRGQRTIFVNIQIN